MRHWHQTSTRDTTSKRPHSSVLTAGRSNLVLEGTAPLMINFISIDEAVMWPGKKAAPEARGARGDHEMMALFKRLDGTHGRVDAMLFATVGGVVTV